VIPTSIAFALVAGAALAAATSTVGTISTLDAAKHKLTLSSGQTFVTPATWNASSYKVGEKVKISYQMKNGAMQATKIVAQ